MKWRRKARCRGMDPGFFYPDHGRGDQIAEAKAVCHECPVRSECLEQALELDEQYGIWGGMSVKERKEEKARRWLIES